MTLDASFHVERADWERDLGALRHVRDLVFINEQQVPAELEWDALDPVSDHVLARDAQGHAIGTGRLTPEPRIGRMAVLAHWRGRGVGSALLAALLDRARERGWKTIEIHAQESALAFYATHGFVAHGDAFDEAGIPHRHMRIELAAHAAAPAVRGVATPRPEPEAIAFTDALGARTALLELLADARHAVALQTHDLDPDLLESDDVLAELRRIATSGRGASLRFLLHDPLAIARRGHRMIALAQRLSSSFELRVPLESNARSYPSAFAINDVGGFVMRPLAERWIGRGNRSAPGEQAPLANWFEETWVRAEPAAELKLLGL